MTVGEIATSLQGLRVVVVGDLMLDEYIFGSITRISPEAPVPVVAQNETRAVPGGAANVAKNAAAFGAKVTLIGVVGEDEGALALRRSLQELQGIDFHLVTDPTRVTTRKTRIIANQAHQVLRVDHESLHLVNDQVEGELVRAVTDALENADVLILSDYLKGVLSDSVAVRVLDLTSFKGIASAANPKPKSAPYYRGAGLVSLNRLETHGLVGWDPQDLSQALKAAEESRAKLSVEGVLVTMGDQGLAAAWEGGGATVPAPKVEVYDTAGAGDTVIATAAMGLAKAGFCPEIFRLAAEASARVVRHVGVAVPSEEDIEELRTLA